jgi:nitrogen fixation-related uncharacterized protein
MIESLFILVILTEIVIYIILAFVYWTNNSSQNN